MLRIRGDPVKYVHSFSRKTVADAVGLGSTINILIKNLDKSTDIRLGAIIKAIPRLAGIFIDSWLMYCVEMAKHQQRIIVYDRYYYDSLVILASRCASLRNQIIAFSKLIPKPNIAILLEITPKTAVERKPEHTIDEAERMCSLYEKFKQLLSINVINVELNTEQVKRRVEKICEGLI